MNRTGQNKSWYDMESYGGAYNQVELQSAADARANEKLESTFFRNGRRYDVGVLRADDNIQLTNNFFRYWYILNLSKTGTLETQL